MSNLFEKGSNVWALRPASRNEAGLVAAVRRGGSSVASGSFVGSTGGRTVSGSESSGLYGSSERMF